MRASLRLLAPRLPPFSPTGITGVLTHPHPRPTLIALYNQTLFVLSQLPAHSVYRQSAENLTKHRLAAVKVVKPDGFESFQTLLQERGLSANDPEIHDVARYMRNVLRQPMQSNHQGYIDFAQQELRNWEEFGASEGGDEGAEASSVDALMAAEIETVGIDDSEHGDSVEEDPSVPLLEPQLTVAQIEEIEEAIGEGLIEEVIEEGWGEYRCAKEMGKTKVWESLEVVPEPGQWVGFERTSGPAS
jgi:NADH dehydrogenase (ubiquinone) 1 alpha subcomplex subunit 5